MPEKDSIPIDASVPKVAEEPTLKHVVRPNVGREYQPINFSKKMLSYLQRCEPGSYQVPALIYGVECYQFTASDGKEVSGCNLHYTPNIYFSSDTKLGLFFEKQSLPLSNFALFKDSKFPLPIILEFEANPGEKFSRLVNFYLD